MPDEPEMTPAERERFDTIATILAKGVLRLATIQNRSITSGDKEQPLEDVVGPAKKDLDG